MAEMKSVLVVNSGSTSLKLNVVAADGSVAEVCSFAAAAAHRVWAVGHRVVHGADRFQRHVIIDDGVRAAIEALTPWAPLHNGPALAAIDAALRALPDVPHVAVFDTAFHRSIPEAASVYAVPRYWRDEWSVRRFGFHGLSVAWCSERAAALLDRPAEGLRLVVCHLGGGCSITAVRDGRSVDTTMGFSPLEGVPMATRSGSIDPAVMIYLLRERGMTLNALEQELNYESGLKALAGGSGDMLDIERRVGAGDRDARLAIDVFVHRVAGAVGSMAVAAGGIDALVFTGGIGDGSVQVRARIAERLGFLGVALDPERNESLRPDGDVAAPSSGVRVLVVRTREELVIARAVLAAVAE